jgi:serine/threonine-protein kinase
VLQTGDILDGRYEVDSLLGRGGMSSVFSGWDRTLGREVAIKVLASELVEDGVFVERFEREARAAASLSHRNVVAVFDSGVDEGARFIVMEHVSGRTLAALLRDGPIPVEQALDIAVGVAEALGAAHSRGIVHRDVKPGNVMIGENGRVKVLDFGIARALAATSLTQASTVIGTAGYLSPEQAEGRQVDARSDLYGLGCVLYEMLTGRPPFVADSAAALVHQHVAQAPEPPSRLRREVSPALDGIALRCLAKDPRERYARASVLSAALIKERADRASASDPRPRAAAPRSRRRQLSIALPALATLALALLLALGSGAGPSRRPSATSASAAAPPAVAGRDQKGAATGAAGRSASTSGPVGSAGPAPANPPASSGQATGAGASAVGALSALTLSDRQHGAIDQKAAQAISRLAANLIAALASHDPAAAARQLEQFARRVDALATAGHIAPPAAAEALKAAAATLAGARLAGSPADTTPPSAPAESDGGEGASPPGTGGGGGHHHDGGGGGGSQD